MINTDLEFKFGKRGLVTISNYDPSDRSASMTITQTSATKLLNRNTIRNIYDHIFFKTPIRKIRMSTTIWDSKIPHQLLKTRWIELPSVDVHRTFYFTRDMWEQERPRYTFSYTKLKQFWEKFKRSKLQDARYSSQVR